MCEFTNTKESIKELIDQVSNHPEYHNLPEEKRWGFSMGVVFNQSRLHKPEHKENFEYAKKIWSRLYCDEVLEEQ